MDLVLRCPFRNQGVNFPPRLGVLGAGLGASPVALRDVGGRGLFSFELPPLPDGFTGGIVAAAARVRGPDNDFVLRCSRFFMNGSRFELLGGGV